MLTEQEIKDRLVELKPFLKEKFFVDEIGYFGSLANGYFSNESDVDIIVQLEKPLGWDFFKLERFLESELKRSVDLATKDALKPQLAPKILKEVIYVN